MIKMEIIQQWYVGRIVKYKNTYQVNDFKYLNIQKFNVVKINIFFYKIMNNNV